MPVTFEADHPIGFITLDNPPANSYDLQVMTEFAAAVGKALSSGVHAVVVRSASEKFFCGGADVKKFLEGDVDANMEMIRVSQRAFKAMEDSSVVFIAHVNGHAMGGGLELTLACDLRYANQGDYKMGTPEVTLGLLPGNGGTQRLPRLVGPSKGMELLITGRAFTPEEGLAMGLLSAVYAADEAAAKIEKQARRLAEGPTLAVAAIKRCVREGGAASLKDGLALEAEMVEQLFRSEDATEGLTAFAEKRAPKFKGA